MAGKKTVREGYNIIAREYLRQRTTDSEDVGLLDDFMDRLPVEAKILDAGCGSGVTITQALAARFDVVGVDFAEKQIELARQMVPAADFLCQDITTLQLPDASFDGICSYYAIIHIPRTEHGALYSSFYNLLKPAGLALLCVGANDLPHDTQEDYFGAEMYWSHFDAAKNLTLLGDVGFETIWSRVVADAKTPEAGHLFVLAQKPAGQSE